MRAALPGLVLAALLACHVASAGPPFLTDDPEPVELGHWEFYAAAAWSGTRDAASGTCPHVEVNSGALPELQLHVIVPAVLAVARGHPAAYGIGDTELGAKFRFIKEGDRLPQVGIFPLVELPTGSEARGLGAGSAQCFIPVWAQKSRGPWTTYGGGGLRFGAGGSAAILGWLLQRDLTKTITFGAEAFWTAPLTDDPSRLQLNLGAIVNLSDRHHVLVSMGPAFGGGSSWQGYLAWQLTI
jgi:hypothetical protein